jgi:hypothetical protein
MAKSKDFTVSISPDTVMYTNISKSKDGYNSARMVAKISDKEYMSISYEWEGNGVPTFAMDLMGFMKTQASAVNDGVWEGQEEAYEEFACKTCKKHNPKAAKKEEKEEICEDCGKPMSKCTCKGGGKGGPGKKEKMKK